MLRSIGIIVFHKHKILLVKDLNNFYSFPKGHRLKYESALDTAWRELYEETALIQKNIKLITNNNKPIYLDEKLNSDKNRYFIGVADKYYNNFKFDKKELNYVGFVDINGAYKLDNFHSERKKILREAYNHYLPMHDL